jgi:hypothetical protein
MDATSVGNNDMLLNYSPSNGIGLCANKSGATLNYESSGIGLTSGTLSSTWHHIVWVMSGSSSTVYFDGSAVKTLSVTGSNVGYHATNPRIGSWYDGVDSKQFHSGSIDDVRLFNRALSLSEVTDLYNATN